MFSMLSKKLDLDKTHESHRLFDVNYRIELIKKLRASI